MDARFLKFIRYPDIFIFKKLSSSLVKHLQIPHYEESNIISQNNCFNHHAAWSSLQPLGKLIPPLRTLYINQTISAISPPPTTTHPIVIPTMLKAESTIIYVFSHNLFQCVSYYVRDLRNVYWIISWIKGTYIFCNKSIYLLYYFLKETRDF